MKDFLKRHGLPMLIAAIVGAIIMIPFTILIFSGEIK